MPDVSAARIVDGIRQVAHPLTGAAAGYDPLLEQIGDARLVLLGEASHGTHEFYRERAEVTKRLIREKGFTAISVEADWPDAYRVNCYVRGASSDRDAGEALGDFKRFPTWMWRNTVVRDFDEWLHAHNAALPTGVPKVGLYGLDLYSLYASIEEVLRYLDDVDLEAAQSALSVRLLRGLRRGHRGLRVRRIIRAERAVSARGRQPARRAPAARGRVRAAGRPGGGGPVFLR